MSRSGYSECGVDTDWAWICWRGAVKSAIRGRRGQAFLRDMRDALDALPEKRLATAVLVEDGECCAMGAVALHRGVDVSGIDPKEAEEVAVTMGIAEALAREIAFLNDDIQSPEKRWQFMRDWVESQIEEPE